MKLFNVLNLYKCIKEGNNGDLKEYSKSMSPEEVDGLRIKSPFIFFILRWIAFFTLRNKKHNLGNTKSTPKQFLSIPKYTEKNLEFFDKVLGTIPDWNCLVLDDYDKNDSYFITLDKKYATNKFDGFEDALQWNCYLATSINRVNSIESKKLYTDTYFKLLKGIDKCLIADKAKKHYAILRHPLKSVKKDLEPVSQDMISGLVLLISEFGKNNNHSIRVLENSIKTKFNTVMEYHDYHLMFPDGTTNSYDLHPNLIYNHIKLFDYIGIRLSQGKFNKDDAKILRYMIQILPPEKKAPYERSWYGLVVAVNALEAILKMYPLLGTNKKIDKVLNKLDFAHLAINWLRHYQKATPEYHPELDSVLFSFYREVGHKDGKKECAKRVLSVINNFVKYDLVEKNSKNCEPVEKYRERYALTPYFRTPADYYWQRSAWRTGYSGEYHPSFDYCVTLARILPFVYYPL